MASLRSHPIDRNQSLASSWAGSGMESEVEDDLQSPLLGGSGDKGEGGGGAPPPPPPLQRRGSLRGPSPLGPGAPLPVIALAGDGGSAGQQRARGSGLLASTVILSKTIVGAGAAAFCCWWAT